MAQTLWTVRADDPRWTATAKSKCVFGIAAGMAHMHNKSLIHRDLKASNVFLDSNYEPVIADFGCSKAIMEDLARTANLGTRPYMAPELLTNIDDTEYDLPVDVYAYAITIWNLFYSKENDGPLTLGNTVITLATLHLINRLIKDGVRWARPKAVSDSLWEVIKACWDQDANARPTFARLVEEFVRNHKYALPDADMIELLEYERKLMDFKARDEEEGRKREMAASEEPQLEFVVVPPWRRSQ
jgi:serine/threonine protein kinase